VQLPDPYDFVRLTTFTLALVWTVRGVNRTRRFLARWEGRLDRWGMEKRWLRRAVFLVVARATVLDPINLALMLVLLGVWTLRAGL
jgi:hypothetical protein